MNYIFRREDNGQLVTVDWETMMQQSGGYITLDNGVQARRCAYLEEQEPQPESERQIKVQAEIVSDRLGIPKHKVAEARELAQQYGHHVEFTPDPHEPTFCQARFPTWHARDEYAKWLGLSDHSSRNGGGSPLSGELLRRSAKRVLEQSPSE